MDRICSIGDFYPYAADFEYVSFDLFDTIIKRRFLRANEVHDTVSVYAQTLMSANGSRTLRPISHPRVGRPDRH